MQYLYTQMAVYYCCTHSKRHTTSGVVWGLGVWHGVVQKIDCRKAILSGGNRSYFRNFRSGRFGREHPWCGEPAQACWLLTTQFDSFALTWE